MGRLIQRFLAHVLPGVIRPLHALWNQMIGFVFLVLGVSPIPSIVRNVRDLSHDPDAMLRIVFLAFFAAVMLYFAITSLWRARKISRS